MSWKHRRNEHPDDSHSPGVWSPSSFSESFVMRPGLAPLSNWLAVYICTGRLDTGPPSGSTSAVSSVLDWLPFILSSRSSSLVGSEDGAMKETHMWPNEGAPANRHLPLASAERRGCLFIGLACHRQRQVPV